MGILKVKGSVWDADDNHFACLSNYDEVQGVWFCIGRSA